MNNNNNSSSNMMGLAEGKGRELKQTKLAAVKVKLSL
jgi:hypothetical protein